ncbi:unnamed protein product, partial [Amoebophrya sp. A120]
STPGAAGALCKMGVAAPVKAFGNRVACLPSVVGRGHRRSRPWAIDLVWRARVSQTNKTRLAPA